MVEPDITAVVNGHREGLLAVATLRSIEVAVARAREHGLKIEVVAVLDRSDALTKEVFAGWSETQADLRIEHIEFGDLGLARNRGAALARGRWLAFLDADDLWTADWLSAAYRAAEAESRVVVWHPEVNLFFGERPHVYLHVDMDDPSFRLAALARTNLWTALCFAPRSLLERVPYRPTAFERQIGYEDWGWHIETIAQGAVHKIVRGAVHGVRTKAVSLVSQTTAAACLPHATDLFRTLLADRGRSDEGRANPAAP